MKKILLLTAFLASMSMLVFASAPSASAFTCGTHTELVNGASQQVATQTTIDFGADLCNKPGANPITAVLLWAINFLAVGVGLAVVVGIIFGGITYAMSDGDMTKAKQGRDIITNAIIGLFLFLFLFAAVNFFVPGGLFK